MRRRKSFVQVEVNHVHAHIAGTRHADERIHVRAVHVNQPARFMHYPANLLDVFFKEAERVRVGQHQSRHIAMRAQLAQVFQVREAFARRANRLHVKAR